MTNTKKETKFKIVMQLFPEHSRMDKNVGYRANIKEELLYVAARIKYEKSAEPDEVKATIDLQNALAFAPWRRIVSEI